MAVLQSEICRMIFPARLFRIAASSPVKKLWTWPRLSSVACSGCQLSETAPSHRRAPPPCRGGPWRRAGRPCARQAAPFCPNPRRWEQRLLLRTWRAIKERSPVMKLTQQEERESQLWILEGRNESVMRSVSQLPLKLIRVFLWWGRVADPLRPYPDRSGSGSLLICGDSDQQELCGAAGGARHIRPGGRRRRWLIR